MFDWDAANMEHIARHGLTPGEVEEVFGNDAMDIGRQLRYGEDRTVHLGETLAGRIVFVVLMRLGELDRVVTAFPADRSNRSLYLSYKERTDA